jgi:putative isomerase
MSSYADLNRRLAAGWNTWNTRSVLSHVLLPEGIAVNLGFKHYAGGDYLKEALIGRRGEHDEQIHPGLRTYDGAYTDLRLSWKGCTWRVQTAAAGDEWVMLVTPLAVATPRPPLVVAEFGLLWNRPGRLSHGEHSLCAETPARSIRLYGTAQPIPEPYIWAQGPYLALPADREVGFATGRALSLDEIRARIDAGRAARARQGESWGEQAELRDAMQSCLAWDTVYDPLFDRVISPVSRIWNTNWGGYVMFCWDSYFAAAMAAVDHKELAYANAIAVTREGIANGFVPNFVSPSGFQSRDRSQPPVGSLTVLEIYRRYREEWFLAEVFDDLLAWNRWWPEHRQLDGLLAWGSHPYTPVVGNGGETHTVNEGFGAALESGLDNAPMYDDIPFDTTTHLLQLQDVGLSSLYIADCDALAQIATTLGRTAEAVELRARADSFRAAMQRLWDEKTGLFLNRRTDTGRFEHRLSPTHFYPLLAGVPTPEQARRMIDEHFFNPDEFWGEWILPSCARNDPAYPEQEYWRGRIWAPMNWLVYLGLRRYDLPEARGALVEKSRALLLKEWREHGHVHENYCADTGQGCNAERSDAFYHWGGLLGLIAGLEHATSQEFAYEK